jgi:hypothetical protein
MRAGGVLMSDGYEPYADIAEEQRLGPEQLPARFIGLIGQLYKVKAEARFRRTLFPLNCQQSIAAHSESALHVV